MKHGLILPKNMRMPRDEKGSSLDLYVPFMNFSHGTGNSVLEQIVSSLYFRGGERFIQTPYDVRLVDNPLTSIYANLLAISSIEGPIISLDDAATFLAGENILIVPPLREIQSVDEMVKEYEDAKAALKSLDMQSETYEQELACVMERIESAISKGTRLRIAEAIEFYQRYLAEYKKSGNPKMAAYFDYHRRIVARSLQTTEWNSLQTIDKLLEQFEKEPSLVNARLVDVFSRHHVNLGFRRDTHHLLTSSRKTYQIFIKSTIKTQDQRSAYASLIALDLMLDDFESANGHLDAMKSLMPVGSFFTQFIDEIVTKTLDNASRSESISLNICPQMKLIGLEDYCRPETFRQMNELVLRFLSGAGAHIWAPSHLDAFESLLAYSRRTLLREIRYEQKEDRLCRTFVYNQEPYFGFGREVAETQNTSMHLRFNDTALKISNSFAVTQLADQQPSNMLGRLAFFVAKILDYAFPWSFNSDAHDNLSSDIDRYIAQSHGIIAIHPGTFRQDGQSIVLQAMVKPTGYGRFTNNWRPIEENSIS